MDSFNQYKRLIRTGVVGLEILIETLFFGYIWTEIYNVRKVVPFENKGHWLMIGFYVLYLVVFVYLYGGTKYAYHRKGQLILSQTLGTLIANAVMYVQIIMVFGVFPFPIVWPMLLACVLALCLAANGSVSAVAPEQQLTSLDGSTATESRQFATVSIVLPQFS